jgi:hypothetical protein
LRRTPSSVAPSAPPSPIFLFTDGAADALGRSPRAGVEVYSVRRPPLLRRPLLLLEMVMHGRKTKLCAR